ncbi:MAG: DNA polymerase III subunit gamma/tau [Deltaproteobacteria bacterium]|nr:DNA polymerase III subunit gamma/tau [Deltaproteobacteria bacterium]
MYLALARKYRPQNFLEVIGQDAIIKTLHNAIQNDRIHHAYLFCGVRGIGKTSLARIMAKSINCQNGPTITPCQECACCKEITAGNSLDVIEIDGASNNLVDDVRELREQVKFLPTASKYKIIIIDEVHMLSKAAFNALLKTLEEPPAHVIFIFATTEAHKIPVTILSRCQKYDFRKISGPVLFNHLKDISAKENIKIEDGALQLIAQCATGSVRDAVSLLDQAFGIHHDQLTEAKVRELLGLADRVIVQEVFKSIVTQDLSESLKLLEETDQRGLDLKLFAETLLRQFRNLILVKSTGGAPVDLSPAEVGFLNELKNTPDVSLLLTQYQILLATIRELALSEYQKTILEIAFVKLHQAQNMMALTDLVSLVKNKGQNVRNADQPVRAQGTVGQSDRPVDLTDSKSPIDWYQLVRWITKEKPPLGGLLKDVIPVTVSDHEIKIAVAPDSQSRGLLIERGPAIQDLIEKNLGRKINFLVTDLKDEKKKPSA